MTLRTKLAVSALALAGLCGAAQAETFEAISAPGFTTETTDLVGYYYAPLVSSGDTLLSYSVLSTAAGFSNTATISFASPQTSYTFLWGSPDAFNTVSDGVVSVTGAGLPQNGVVYTFSDAAGFSSLTFTTSDVAFELAGVSVAAVPEPETYALMLAGLAAVGYAARRRKQA